MFLSEKHFLRILIKKCCTHFHAPFFLNYFFMCETVTEWETNLIKTSSRIIFSIIFFSRRKTISKEILIPFV